MLTRTLALLTLAPLLWTACADAPEPAAGVDTLATITPDPDTVATPLGMEGDLAVGEAAAVLSPASGSTVQGRVAFTALSRGVRVLAQVGGLPEGAHGFHIHETGDCSAADASSAGGHFNPTGAAHGAPDAAERHVGDLGNIEARADSTAGYDRIDAMLTLDGPNGIIGKAVVVHSGADDYTSQPSGDAGRRLACGVIQTVAGPDIDT